ncbi:MAG: hypothetical protein K1X74_22925, partial [Pirellulales bacterium]|nr:hypothetical protein [Pirellulales bacterium]
MSQTVDDFWRLSVDAGLISPERRGELDREFRTQRGAAATSKDLAKYLVERRVISGYQATVLAAGHPGPFHYGPYLVFHRHSSGPLAQIFRARHLPTQHVVLLRFLTGERSSDAETLERAAARAAYAAQRNEPRLSQAWTLVDLAQYKFLVAEALEAAPLAVWMAKAGPQPIGEACRVVREIALGLVALHAAGEIHGAVHGGNVLRHANGNVQLLSWPLVGDPLAPQSSVCDERAIATARALGEQAGSSSPEQAATALCVAPELLVASSEPDARCDVYALGWLLLQLLTAPQQSPTAHEVTAVLVLRKGAATPWAGAAERLPSQVQKLLSYFLAPDPAARYQTAAQAAEALRVYAERSPLTVPAPAPAATAAAYRAWLAVQAPAPSSSS